LIQEGDQSHAKFGNDMSTDAVIPFVKYVLIGGGMASYYAMQTIKKMDKNAQILIIGEEANVPYSRPPLSKELWDSSDEDLQNYMFKDYTGNMKSIFYDSTLFVNAKETDDFASCDKVYFLKGTVSSIDTAEESVKLSNGSKIKYGKLLIATGGSPKTLPVVKDLPKESRDRVLTFRGVSLCI
jgi:programmed cell death 8 (apoptosis-inducing factor)